MWRSRGEQERVRLYVHLDRPCDRHGMVDESRSSRRNEEVEKTMWGGWRARSHPPIPDFIE